MAPVDQEAPSVGYTGAVGQTRTAETTIWCPGCGTLYGAAHPTALNARTDPDAVDVFRAGGYAAISTHRCPNCDTPYTLEDLLVVHDPDRARLILVIPEGQRHAALQHKARLQIAVAEAPGDQVPAYALSPLLVVGDKGFAAIDGADETPAVVMGTVSAPVDAPQVEAAAEPRAVALVVPVPPAEDAELSAPPDNAFAEVESDAEGDFVDALPGALDDGLGDPGDPDSISVDGPASILEVAEAQGPSLIDFSSPDAESEPETSGFTRIEFDEEEDEPAAPARRHPELEDAWAEPGEPEAPDPSSTTLVTPSPDDAPTIGEPAAARPVEPEGYPPPVELSMELEPAESTGSNLSIELELDADEAPPEEATHVIAAEAVGIESEPAADEVTGVRAAPRRLFDEDAAKDSDRYLKVDGDRVAAAIRVPSELAEAFDDQPRLYFQLHEVEAGPVMSLAMTPGEEGEPTGALVWLVRHEEAAQTEVLNTLRNRFEVDVLLYGLDDVFLGRRRFRLPLEDNVASAWSRVMEVEAELGRRLNRAQARAAVADEHFDRFGKLNHGFTQDAFSELITASQARLALGILAWWSDEVRRSHLLRVRAFPEIWFEEMQRRVLTAALSFGLAMDPHMRQRALDLELSASPEELVRVALANFAEVNLNLKPNDLDPLDLWSNWEALLASAEALEIRVDEEIEELAAHAMEKARVVARSEGALEPVEESVDIEEMADLEDLSPPDLVALLEAPGHRLEATLALLRRGDPVYVPSIFDALLKMNREEMLQAVPAILSMGPAFESALLSGLRSRRSSVRLASALALAEIRSERAVGALLSLVRSADDAQWPILARAAARIGRRVVSPAVAAVKAHNDRGDRLAFTLALLGPDARGALGAALDQASEEAVQTCLERALARIGSVSFGDAVDFGERLADAFDTAGPDEVGPDFEEDLASIDLGPGASIEALEMEVDLDGLEEGQNRRR